MIDQNDNQAQVATTREAVSRLIQERGYSQGKIAKETGISAAALSHFRKGTYTGDNQAVAAKLLTWIDSVAARDSMATAMQAHGFVDTTQAVAALSCFTLAQAAPDIVVVVGHPGLGKTTFPEQYRRTHPNIWICTMSPDTEGLVPMFEEIAIELGIKPEGGAAKVRRSIIDRVRGTGGLVIVDESHHLKPKSLDAARRIADSAGIGMAFVGQPELLAKIKQLPQVNSRIGKIKELPKPSRADVAAMAKALGVVGKDEVEFLYGIAQLPGGYRNVVKCVQAAALNGVGDRAGVTRILLAKAWAARELEGRQ
jgi:hypothetical protein